YLHAHRHRQHRRPLHAGRENGTAGLRSATMPNQNPVATADTLRRPFALAVAPNGARKTHADHACLPITPDELAQCARECVDAGAAMIHLHVRKADATHSLEVVDYEPAIAAVRKAVGNALVLQLTTEAV